MNSTAFRPVWWLLFAVHLVVITASSAGDPVVLAVVSSSAVLLLSAWFSFTGDRLLSMMLPLLVVAINVMTFGYMNLLYLWVTDGPFGLHHELTAWLASLQSACVMVGACLVHVLIGRERIPSKAPPIVMRPEPMIVALIIFGMLAFGHISTGWLNARWERSSDFGAGYLVAGLGPIPFMFFLMAGTRLQPSLNSTRALLVLGFVTLLALLQGLSGSRGWSVYMILLMLAGAAWARIGMKTLGLLASGFAVAATVFSLIVQEARGREGFGYGTPDQRATVLLETATDVREGRSSGDSTFEPLISRMFEFSAQIVIDQTEVTRLFAGFEGFERLELLFVPQALAPDKLPVSDGKEILVRDYGYVLDDRTGVPITLIADSYRRGGEVWVALVGLIAGAALRLLTRFTVLAVGADLALIPLVLYMTLIVGFPMESVLGAISIVTYHWVKQMLIFTPVAIAMRFFVTMNDDRVRRRTLNLTAPGDRY